MAVAIILYFRVGSTGPYLVQCIDEILQRTGVGKGSEVTMDNNSRQDENIEELKGRLAMLSGEMEATGIVQAQMKKISLTDDFDKAMNEMLATVGSYMKAERMYIFEGRGEQYPASYEWCAGGEHFERQAIQEATGNELLGLLSTLQNDALFISDVEEIKENRPQIYSLLVKQDIHSVLAVPVITDGKTAGFLGVDNAPYENTKLVINALCTLGVFLGNVIQMHREQRKNREQGMEAELDAANDIQAQMLDAISCGVFAYTYAERKIIIMNDVAKRIMECESEDFKLTFHDFCHNRIFPEDYKEICEKVRLLKKPGDFMRYIFHVRKKNNDVLTVRCRTKLCSFSDGSWYILSSMLDITEETDLRNVLSIERRQYRDAVLEGAEFSVSIDLTAGYLNDSIHTENGEVMLSDIGLSIPASYEDVLEKWLVKKQLEPRVGFPEDTLYRETLLKKYESGIARIRTEYYSSYFDKYYSILVLLSEMKKNSHVHAVFIVYDITEREKEQQKRVHQIIEAKENLSAADKKLHNALASEKEKTSVIRAMSNIYYGSYMVDLHDESISLISGEGTISRYITGSGNAKEDFKNWIDNVIHENFREEMAVFTNIMTLPERMRDTQIISRDCISCEAGWIRISFIALDRDAGGLFERVLLVAQHIDGEKQKELSQKEALKAAFDAANRANSAKTQFLASMSHDIRTPMNAIIGMTAIAATHLEDKERVSDCLNKITISSKHLLGLINEVLDMSKIESGKIDLSEEEFSLPELINNLLTMVKPQIDAKHHELAVTIRGIEHEKVIGDNQRIQQAFMNLMGNAIKYTPDGGKISLTISEKLMNKKNVGCYEFIFEDNGIGMSKEFLEHLFDPFSRASDSRISKIQGTGLGMAITRNMVQMMNGNIEVESELDKGTKITLTIVLKLQDEDETLSYEEFEDLPILVVDDDRIACESTCEILEELGMKGEWVLSGREAVDLVIAHHEKEDDFFAVIIDWRMPEMNGIQTTKEIRRRVGNEVPIIIISAYDWSDIELEARAAGANAFISKPLFKSGMAHLFNELLGRDVKDDNVNELNKIVKDDFTGFRALLVEDNDLNAEIAGEILGMAGLTVDYAKDGKEALDIISAAEDGLYDIIFMDIRMPVMDGYDTTIAIRSLPGNYAKSVPIIAMTANAFTDDIHAAKRAGMNQHMAKPINLSHLMAVLHKWLD